VQHHKDECMYELSSGYTTNAGHFHSETAEQPWVYINLFSSQARQMTHGNCHDLYNNMYNYWNFKKFIHLHERLCCSFWHVT
ncbi:hypothetical protein FA15DRAFT_600123, partial [Coprinopsis marcescibilis]